MSKGITGVILAGGQSRRMGQPKALLPWQGRTLIDAVVDRLQPVVNEVLIVAKDTAPLAGRGARVVADLRPEPHPLTGLYTGLLLARYDVSFVCACDMPWLDPDMIRRLHGLLDGYDAVAPQHPNGRVEPLHALYARRCAAVLARWPQTGPRTLLDFLGQLYVRIAPPQALDGVEGWAQSLTNLNTPAEYAQQHKER